jgi:aspartyl protease family protein
LAQSALASFRHCEERGEEAIQPSPSRWIVSPRSGASLVSVTKSFANKAIIVANNENKITLQTANGLADGLLATANSIQVGNAYSTFVPVVVVDDAKLQTDDNIAGLLGMSFLSRFDMKFGKDTVELRNRF